MLLRLLRKMSERLINLSAWRNKEQMLRFRGVKCLICGKYSLQERPCYHPEGSQPAKDQAQTDTLPDEDQGEQGNHGQ